ncbi:Transposase (plasmid) [Nostoc flagelliforme CCNUN1]|uniref:Transposase n=1 Tax=Nostoc flagelliforme CCNUN1 TaxID=2038116 RepID=A0A2K8T810_9NOSO|nr:transposase [Nostoc flagelliforme]AUB43812.1 Transposase [Nostoc flagelliforme CCNUN1]
MLSDISQQFTDSVLIIQLDNGAFHKAKRLQLADNIILLFQPAHSPELNPIEQVWQYIKRRLRWLLPKNLDDLRAALYLEIGKLTKPIIASIAQRQYIMVALSIAGF